MVSRQFAHRGQIRNSKGRKGFILPLTVSCAGSLDITGLVRLYLRYFFYMQENSRFHCQSTATVLAGCNF